MSSLKEDLERRARNAILKHALFDWKVAATASLGTLLSVGQFLGQTVQIFDPTVPWPVWAVGGLIGAAVIFYVTLTDPETASTAVAEMLHEELQPQRLRNRDLQRKVSEAIEYHQRILRAIKERGDDSLIASELADIAAQMNEWVEEIHGLASRIDQFRQENSLMQRSKQAAQTRINLLEQQISFEANEQVRQEMTNNIESLQYQLQTINNLEDTMQRAMLMLDNKLTNMNTIYLQTTLMGAKEIDNSRARRLRHDIAREVQEMDDILVTMEEVYSHNLSG